MPIQSAVLHTVQTKLINLIRPLQCFHALFLPVPVLNGKGFLSLFQIRHYMFLGYFNFVPDCPFLSVFQDTSHRNRGISCFLQRKGNPSVFPVLFIFHGNHGFFAALNPDFLCLIQYGRTFVPYPVTIQVHCYPLCNRLCLCSNRSRYGYSHRQNY